MLIRRGVRSEVKQSGAFVALTLHVPDDAWDEQRLETLRAACARAAGNAWRLCGPVVVQERTAGVEFLATAEESPKGVLDALEADESVPGAEVDRLDEDWSLTGKAQEGCVTLRLFDSDASRAKASCRRWANEAIEVISAVHGPPARVGIEKYRA